jgi:hypothetical protein
MAPNSCWRSMGRPLEHNERLAPLAALPTGSHFLPIADAMKKCSTLRFQLSTGRIHRVATGVLEPLQYLGSDVIEFGLQRVGSLTHTL